MIEELNTQIVITNSLIEQHEIDVANNTSEAEAENSSASPDELPQQNDKDMNDIEISYRQSGEQVIIYNWTAISLIANQCPYSGGPAVYKARGWLEQYSDSLFYDDVNVCLSQGIFRQGHLIAKNNVQIKINPNPNNGIFELIVEGVFKNKCTLIIKDVVGKVCLVKRLNCNQNKQTVELSEITGGVYVASVLTDDRIIGTQKIILIK